MRLHDLPTADATSFWGSRLAACAPQNVKERGGQAEVRSVTELLPLDRARWLARDVVDDAVDAFDFVNDAVGDAGEQFVRQSHPIGGHAILAFDDAQSDGVIVGALVAHDADALHREQHGEGLPDAVIPVARFHFALHDGIGIAQDVEGARE